MLKWFYVLFLQKDPSASGHTGQAVNFTPDFQNPQQGKNQCFFIMYQILLGNHESCLVLFFNVLYQGYGSMHHLRLPGADLYAGLVDPPGNLKSDMLQLRWPSNPLQ